MIAQALKRLGPVILELLLTLLLVLGSYLLITGLLDVIFPLGISLRQAVQYRGEEEVREEQKGPVDAKGVAKAITATLSFTRNDVKSKRFDSIAWSRATPGMPLFSRDSVQTLDDSTAQVKFDEKNTLTIGVNTLIIVKSIEKDEQRKERRSVVLVVDGDLTGNVSSSKSDPLHLIVSAPAAVAKIAGGNARNTDFRISTNADNSSTFVVYKGAVEVSARGKTVRVTQNTGVTVKAGEAPPDAVPLPDAPELKSPVDKAQLPSRRIPAQVDFAWSGALASEFRLQVARDAKFTDLVCDRRQPGTGFSHRYLKSGTYYWRVAGIDQGREGRKSAIRIFEIKEKTLPPSLQVTFPPGPVEEEQLLVSGSTDAGVRLFVSGMAVPVAADGTFRCEVPLKSGMNLITLEAFDAAGNVTYRSHNFERRLQP